MRRTVAILLAVVALGASAAAESVLLMVESPGCVYCAAWRRDVGEEYPKTAEGRAAPLRHVDLSLGWPADLAHVQPERLTPTFILLRDGREVGRLRGYAGEDFFWPMLAELIARPTPD